MKKFLIFILITLNLFNNIFPNAGALDPSFNGTGKVITSFGSNSSEDLAIAIDSNDKIIIVGGIGTSISDFKYLIGRYNTNGSLDTTFNSAGSVPGTDAQTFDSSGPSVGTDVVLQSDNKIVLTGVSFSSTNTNMAKFGLARYNTNGTLDPTFGTGGKVAIPFMQGINVLDSQSNTIALQSDKIIAAGYIRNSNIINFGLARYNIDGTLDATFGNGVTTPGTLREDLSSTGSDNSILDIAIQPDGKILAAGYSRGENGSFVLARFNADGSGLDTSFNSAGTPGKIINQFPGNPGGNSEATSLLLLSDGSIIIGGDNGASIAFAKFKSDGTIDTSFGVNGFSVIQIPTNMRTDIALQNGKIVASFFVTIGNGSFGVLRLNSDGTADPTFGNMGVVVTNFTNFGAGALAIAVQPDLKIVAGGVAFTSGSQNTGDVALARYLNTTPCVTPTDALTLAIQQKYGI